MHPGVGAACGGAAIGPAVAMLPTKLASSIRQTFIPGKHLTCISDFISTHRRCFLDMLSAGEHSDQANPSTADSTCATEGALPGLTDSVKAKMAAAKAVQQARQCPFGSASRIASKRARQLHTCVHSQAGPLCVPYAGIIYCGVGCPPQEAALPYRGAGQAGGGVRDAQQLFVAHREEEPLAPDSGGQGLGGGVEQRQPLQPDRVSLCAPERCETDALGHQEQVGPPQVWDSRGLHVGVRSVRTTRRRSTTSACSTSFGPARRRRTTAE